MRRDFWLFVEAVVFKYRPPPDQRPAQQAGGGFPEPGEPDIRDDVDRRGDIGLDILPESIEEILPGRGLVPLDDDDIGVGEE